MYSDIKNKKYFDYILIKIKNYFYTIKEVYFITTIYLGIPS